MTTSGTCERKLPPSRSFWPALAFGFSRIASYVPSPARPNLTKIRDPCVYIFCWKRSKVIKEVGRR